MQVSSGMAGALIVDGGNDANGGLDTVRAIAEARKREKIFVLQQFNYGVDGQIEDFTGPGERNWLGRGVMVNGQLAPVIRMRPGEIQRWRFIHAGVQEHIQLALDQHQLHEIAVDGIALGRLVSWPASQPINGERDLVLGPGYRSDVLVRATELPPGVKRRVYFLRDLRLGPNNSLTAAAAALRLSAFRAVAALTAQDILDETLEKPESIVAQLIVEGEPIKSELPRADELITRVPSELRPITDDELKANPDPEGPHRLAFTMAYRVCTTPDGNCPTPPPNTECDSAIEPNCRLQFMINDRLYMPHRSPRRLKLGTASTWILTGNMMRHPFHIHVNPFQVERLEPGSDGTPRSAPVWKDTVLLPADEKTETIIRTRYTRFTGQFVLHCHILGHEDLGMMERVEIYQQ
jgi:FtsP/CotA-like multicopper oxidase with cupredoxin domain